MARRKAIKGKGAIQLQVETAPVRKKLKQIEDEFKLARILKTLRVVVGYSMPYAIYVHENLQAYHRHGQAKYLEEPARTKSVQISKAIIDTAIAAKGKGRLNSDALKKGLYAGGLTLQRESQKLVPVDTGALKRSAYTKLEGDV